MERVSWSTVVIIVLLLLIWLTLLFDWSASVD